MPLLTAKDYTPGFFLRNGHINSMYPYFFRKQPEPNYCRKRIFTPDKDFLDIDFTKVGSRKVALLCHGLEGDSNSQYIIALSRLLSQNGWDTAALNYRSCSGEMNWGKTLYHSGATHDIHTTLLYLEKYYDSIDIIGYSLGGNLTMKYLGEDPARVSPKVRTGIAVSAPIDLDSASVTISRLSNWHYNKNFRIHLGKKVIGKNKQYPELFDLNPLQFIRTLMDFDRHYTAPVHGFEDEMDYYLKAKAIQFMPNVRVPSLLINSKDDPFLSKECYPKEMLEAHEFIYYIEPDYGGHCGFVTEGREFYWVEEKILWFLREVVEELVLI